MYSSKKGGVAIPCVLLVPVKLNAIRRHMFDIDACAGGAPGPNSISVLVKAININAACALTVRTTQVV